jgi:D-alanyl-D-alanine carboxypeptidase
MFSFLVALTLYAAFQPVRSSVPVEAYLPRTEGPPKAAQVRAATGPVKKDPGRLGIATTARAAAVVDWETGTTLFEKNADAPMPIASITKLMTALVVLSTVPDWDKDVLVLGSDHRPGGIPYVAPGERIAVRDLFNLSLIASANNATVALARSTGLTPEEFVARMNVMASAIGMRNARFADPTGLDPGNVASARDVAALIKKSLSSPEIRDALRMPTYAFTARTGRYHAVRSTDYLLWSFLNRPPYAFLGGKTGFIDEAGYCFGAAAQNGDGKAVAVVLGAPTKGDRFREVKGLLYWAFDAYEWPKGSGETPH